MEREQRRRGLYNGSSNGPHLDAEMSGGRANGSVMTNVCPTASDDQEEDYIIDI